MAAQPGKRKRERRARLTATRYGVRTGARPASSLAAIGIEAEFVVVIDGVPVRPEDVFGSPRRIIRGPLLHRTGRSYHLPTGSAMYFDTGVIELATPMIELERGCAARAGRSLWESILFLRRELDAWQERQGRDVRLVGFSTHYNVSFTPPAHAGATNRTVEQLALLLTYILPAPVMLLAANRQSTGIGVRPRGNRIEITADFTPDAALMIATATFVVGVACDVMSWPNYDLSIVTRGEERDLPIFRDFAPVPHSSRKGWVARQTCFPRNPFTAHVDDDRWELRRGEAISLREIAGRITKRFWPAIRRYADPFTLRLIGAVMAGRTPSLLELADRPPAYESVGRLCAWEDLFPEHELPRSRYERVLIRAIHGDRLRLGSGDYTPTGMRGWSHVVFRRERDRTKHVFSLDYLLRHLDDWEADSR
jgi:hypothetical protein